jgi:hypothetical protein
MRIGAWASSRQGIGAIVLASSRDLAFFTLYISYRKLWADSCDFSGIFSKRSKDSRKTQNERGAGGFSQSVELDGHYVQPRGGERTMDGIDDVARRGSTSLCEDHASFPHPAAR